MLAGSKGEEVGGSGTDLPWGGGLSQFGHQMANETWPLGLLMDHSPWARRSQGSWQPKAVSGGGHRCQTRCLTVPGRGAGGGGETKRRRAGPEPTSEHERGAG